MLDRLVDRLPALLLLAVVLFSAHVALFDARQNARLVAIIPASALLVLYLRAGSGGGKAASGGKSGKRRPARSGGDDE